MNFTVQIRILRFFITYKVTYKVSFPCSTVVTHFFPAKNYLFKAN